MYAPMPIPNIGRHSSSLDAKDLGLPLIKYACLLRQRRPVPDTLSLMSWDALILWKEKRTDELCR